MRRRQSLALLLSAALLGTFAPRLSAQMRGVSEPMPVGVFSGLRTFLASPAGASVLASSPGLGQVANMNPSLTGNLQALGPLAASLPSNFAAQAAAAQSPEAAAAVAQAVSKAYEASVPAALAEMDARSLAAAQAAASDPAKVPALQREAGALKAYSLYGDSAKARAETFAAQAAGARTQELAQDLAKRIQSGTRGDAGADGVEGGSADANSFARTHSKLTKGQAAPAGKSVVSGNDAGIEEAPVSAPAKGGSFWDSVRSLFGARTSASPAPAPKPAAKDQFARLSGLSPYDLAAEMGAAFGLEIRAEADKSFYAYTPSGYGVPSLGFDRYPDKSGYLVSPETVELAARVLNGEEVPRALQKSFAPVLEALRKYQQKGENSPAAALAARLEALRAKTPVMVDGKPYLVVGPSQYGGAETAVASDPASLMTAKPEISRNGLTHQDVLADDGKYGDILTAPAQYAGGAISYNRKVPRVEGSEVVVVTDAGAYRGVYRGWWLPGYQRGYPLNEYLRHHKLADVRLHFVEVKDGGETRIAAVPGDAPGLRIFSTARPSR